MRNIVIRLLALSCISAGFAFSQPKFNLIGGTKFDFGDLYFGAAKKVLMIRNDGTDTLIVSNISASCGCTGTLMSNDHILPGDSGALSIMFHTRNLAGHAEKAVTLDSNDPDHKHVRIIFTANVIGVLDVVPDYLYFQTNRDSIATQTVTIKNRGTESFNITSTTTTLDNVGLKLSDSRLRPGQEATLTVTLTPKSAGTLKGNIEIDTDHPKVPSVSVRVFALVTGKKPAQ